jgi:hypothetical protein
MSRTRTILSALGLAAVGGVAVAGDALFGPWGGWSILLVGGYIVGGGTARISRFEIMSSRRTVRVIEGDPRTDKYRVAVHKELAKDRRKVASLRRHLGRRVSTEMAEVVAKIDDILSKWAQLMTTVDDRFTVEAMITDYIPGLLEAYRNLPGHKFRKTWLPEQVRAWDALGEQVRILDAEALRIQKTLYSTDLRSVEAHGTFLRDKYARRPGLEINRD